MSAEHVVLAGYRDWALRAFSRIELASEALGWGIRFSQPRSPVELTRILDAERRQDPSAARDAVVFCAGWSWILPGDVVASNLCLGVHPSDLPAYAGGSPIQHQVLDGVTHTSATLFRLRPRLDAGEIVEKVDLSLEGHMDQIFRSLEDATVSLFARTWIKRRAGILTFTPQPGGGAPPRRRLRPEDSRLPTEAVAAMTCRQLWDAIRCREDPYPNAYLEDGTGRLVLRRVEFEPAVSQ